MKTKTNRAKPKAPKKTHVGDRVRLVRTTDRHTPLQAGDEGTVAFIDDEVATIFVEWDSGHLVGLIEGEDRWSVSSDGSR